MRRLIPFAAAAAVLLVTAVLLATRERPGDAATRALAVEPAPSASSELTSTGSERRATFPTDAPARRAATDAAPPTETLATAPLSRPFIGAVIVEVVHRDGSPAAGADVTWLAGQLPREREQQIARAEARARDGGTRLWPHAGRAWWVDPRTRRVLADELGRAYLPAAVRDVTVTARVQRDDELLRGEVWLADAESVRPGRVHRLELEPVESVRVRVVDPSGAPVAGIPVAVVAAPPGRDGRLSGYTAGETDAEGRLTLEDTPPGWATARADGRTPRVALVLAAVTPVDAPLVPGGEVELVLPPLGTVVVEFADGGHDGRVLEFGPADANPFFYAEIFEGRATFAPVALGLEFEAMFANQRPPLTERFAGPTAAEPMLVHRWSTPASRATWRVTLVDEHGAAFADRFVSVGHMERIRGGGRAAGGRVLRTDRDGSLAYVPSFERVGDVTLSFFAFDEERVAGRRRERSASLEVTRADDAPGEPGDLGTVVLAPSDVLVAGMTVDERGEPVPDVRLQVAPAGTVSAPDRQRRPSATSDELGRFIVWGEPPAEGPLELAADAPGYHPPAPVPFTIGTEDALVELAAGTAVEATLRLPEGLTLGAITVALERPDRTTRTLTLISRIAVRRPVRQDVRFALDDLAPGPARFTVTSVPSREVVYAQDLHLAGGLVDLGLVDLTDLLPVFELSVAAAGGARIATFSARFVEADSNLLFGLTSPVRLARPRDGEHVAISATGYLPKEAPVDGPRVHVELTRADPLVLVVPPGFPAPPEGSPLHLRFERLSGDDAQHTMPFLPVSPTGTYRVTLGAPGRFAAELTRVASGRMRRLARAEFELTAAALASGGPIEMPFDLDEWTAALDAEGTSR